MCSIAIFIIYLRSAVNISLIQVQQSNSCMQITVHLHTYVHKFQILIPVHLFVL